MSRADSTIAAASARRGGSLLPRALWWKAWADARLLLAALLTVTVLFQVIYVWMSSQVELGALGIFLNSLPASFEKMLGFPLAVIATPTGRLAMAYVHPVTTFVAASWAVARGSDCISGEIGRGTMEMLLAQPVRRWSIIVTHGLTTTAGAVLLACTAWLGTWFGVLAMGYQKLVDPLDFIPPALNLFGFIFFLAAASTLASAFDSDRRRTIGLMCGFYLLQLLMKLVARAVASLSWLEYGTFFGAFQPELLSIHPATAWRDMLLCNACLIGAGLLAYAGSVAVFARRDLPAPL